MLSRKHESVAFHRRIAAHARLPKTHHVLEGMRYHPSARRELLGAAADAARRPRCEKPIHFSRRAAISAMQLAGVHLRGASRLSQGSNTRSDSPWDATTARELQDAAEGQLSHWRQRARKAEKEAESLMRH